MHIYIQCDFESWKLGLFSLWMVQVVLNYEGLCFGVWFSFWHFFLSGPPSRWQSCCVSAGQESICTCSVTFCAVLLELENGPHTFYRFVYKTQILICYCIDEVINSPNWFFLFFSSQIQILGNNYGVQHFMQALTILMSPARWTQKLVKLWIRVSVVFHPILTILPFPNKDTVQSFWRTSSHMKIKTLQPLDPILATGLWWMKAEKRYVWGSNRCIETFK